MKHNWEKQIKDGIHNEISSVVFSEADENRILDAVHRQTMERSRIMTLSGKKIRIVLAAAMIAVGAVTAVSAGRITGLVSHTCKNEAILEADQLLPAAAKKLGQKPKIAGKFSDGLTFSEGYVTDVSAVDEAGNHVDSYPETIVHYQGSKDVTLNISKPLASLPREEKRYMLEETYQDIQLKGTIEQYLFLPPSQEPSEEDKKLEEEGRLMIGYGSETEERKSFKSVLWEEDGLRYHIFSFDDIGLEKLAGYAKEIISMK